jgi:zinc-ribbon domain/GYF domain 2/LITAF-like zinc ribbon domain
MGFCANCGNGLADDARFCTACGYSGSKALVSESAGGTAVELTPSPSPTWHVTYAGRQTGGPYTEDEIKSMIARQQIKITDSVAALGSKTWVPITQSPFGQYIVSQATVDRLVSTTCPQCGAAMAVVLRRSTACKVFVGLGIVTIWMFGFGLIFLVIAYFLGRTPQPRYECPRCKYKAR